MDEVSKTVERPDAVTGARKGVCVSGIHEIVESEEII